MNSLGSWIDKSELERLVAAVGPKHGEKDSMSHPQSSQAQPGSKFSWNRPESSSGSQPVPGEPPAAPPAPERFPIAEEVEKFRDKVAAIKDKARALGVLSPGGSKSADSYVAPQKAARVKTQSDSQKGSGHNQNLPNFRPPQGPLRLRLECFGEWAATITRAQAVIVADSQGDLVFERGADPAWVSSVTMVATAGERAGRNLAISGNTLIHLDLPADRKLAVLPCQTKFGHLNVGLVVPSPLRHEVADSIAEAIAAVIARN